MVVCKDCQSEYPAAGMPFRCPSCEGIFDYESPPAYSKKKIDLSQPGIWRYRDSFELSKQSPVTSLGEGNTPLLKDKFSGKNIAFKLEFLNPTGSHKDRATSILVSRLIERGITSAIEDSSGNAGASFAAYAARFGIRAKIYIPKSASGAKRKQIERYGAETITIEGPRIAATKAVYEAAAAGDIYASHAYLPFGINGLATIAYEIWDDLRMIPGSVIIPAGHGSLALGIMRGFSALKHSGIIESTPFYVMVQPKACAPICLAFQKGSRFVASIKAEKTIAEGTSVSSPVRGNSIIDELLPGQGAFLTIQEEDILPAYHELAQRGLYVEPTSALVWSGLKILISELPEPVILILTGSGLKY